MLLAVKAHHCMGDGASALAGHLCIGDEYDYKKLIKFRGVPWHMRLLLRLALPFYIPVVIFKGLTLPFSKNLLHDGKRQLTGVKKVASVDNLSFSEVKAASRRLNMTINNMVTACLS